MSIQSKVFGIRTRPREHDARGIDAAAFDLCTQVRDHRIVLVPRQKPENGIGHGRENERPNIEDLRVQLVRAVEAAEHDAGRREL